MSLSIVCIGGLTLDWHEKAPIRTGPVPGGNALYSCVGAWLAGSTPTLVADVGNDYPEELLQCIADVGIGTQWLRRTKQCSDQVLLKNEDGLREINFIGRPERRPVDFTPLQAAGHLAVHVCGMEPMDQEYVLRVCREARIRSSLDLIRTTIDGAMVWGDLIHLAGMADVFLPSIQDLDGILPARAEDALIRLGAEIGRPTVIRMGKEGSIGVADGRIERLQAVPCVPIDLTGAGDAYCGAFQSKWIETGNLRTAMAWGAAAASVVIQDFGATHALTQRHRNETERRARGAVADAL